MKVSRFMNSTDNADITFADVDERFSVEGTYSDLEWTFQDIKNETDYVLDTGTTIPAIDKEIKQNSGFGWNSTFA